MLKLPITEREALSLEIDRYQSQLTELNRLANRIRPTYMSLVSRYEELLQATDPGLEQKKVILNKMLECVKDELQKDSQENSHLQQCQAELEAEIEKLATPENEACKTLDALRPSKAQLNRTLEMFRQRCDDLLAGKEVPPMPFLETLYYFVSNEELDRYLKGLLGVDLNWARDIKRPGKLEKVASAVIAFFHDDCPELQSRLSKPEAGKDWDTWFAHFEVDMRRFADLVIEEITQRPKFIECIGKFADKRLAAIAKKLLDPGKKETMHIPRQHLNQIAYSVNPSYTQLKKLGNDWVKRLEKRAQGEAKQLAQQEQARLRKELLPLIEPAKLENNSYLLVCYANVVYQAFLNDGGFMEYLANVSIPSEGMGQNEIQIILRRLLLGVQEMKREGKVIPNDYWKPLQDHLKSQYPLGQQHCALSYWRELVQNSPQLADYFAINYSWNCACSGSKRSIRHQWPYVMWTQEENENPQTFQSKLQSLILDQIKPSSSCSACQTSYQLADWKAPKSLNIQIGLLDPDGSKVLNLTDVIPLAFNLDTGNAREAVSYELQSVIFHAGDPDRGHYYNYAKRSGHWYKCDGAGIAKVSEAALKYQLQCHQKGAAEGRKQQNGKNKLRIAQLTYAR